MGVVAAAIVGSIAMNSHILRHDQVECLSPGCAVAVQAHNPATPEILELAGIGGEEVRLVPDDASEHVLARVTTLSLILSHGAKRATRNDITTEDQKNVTDNGTRYIKLPIVRLRQTKEASDPPSLAILLGSRYNARYNALPLLLAGGYR